MTKMSIRGISLHVKIFGKGHPLVLMHGGPGADLFTLLSLKPLAKQFTLVFYDHRCNGRSSGAEVSSMTMENLTADADALRQALGFKKWAVLGHSFGGNVALEYALRYPQNLSHLLLINTGADFRWACEKGPELLAKRGYPADIVDTARRFFNGNIAPKEMFPSLMKMNKAYNPYMTLGQALPMMFDGIQTKLQPEALIFANSHLLKNWNVMDRLGEINAPTLILAGGADFLYPPEHQRELAAAIPNSRLVLIERAGHNPQDEQPGETLAAIRTFMQNTAAS